jgi:CRP/FNR family cyclic AMP-dependent transcriptional regulator
MSGPKKLNKGDILFREGDPSEAMYVIKSGKIAIMKTKGSSEIQLAELGPGDMLGEMAFFDNKPRSAGAKAMMNTEVIELPFRSLNAQFKTFPEWLKAIMRTVNTHLRNANTKIKNLEKTSEDDATFFTPHLVTRLASILGLVAHRYGEKVPEGTLVPPNRLRNYTIQIFQQPTSKMTRFQEVLQGLGHMKIEDIGEGKQKLNLFKPDVLMGFADFYNDWIFKSEEKRTTIDDKELKPLRALVHFGRRETPDAKGNVKVNLTNMQNESMRELSYLFSADDVNGLADKKVTGEKTSGDGGNLFIAFNLVDIENLTTYWEIIHACKKVGANN